MSGDRSVVIIEKWKSPHMKLKITPGTSESVYNNQQNNPLFSKPVFQILNWGKMTSETRRSVRVKVNLSDSVYTIVGIFSTEYTGHFDSGMINNFSLIELDDFEVKKKGENHFVYIRSIGEFENYGCKIGNPVSIKMRKQSLERQFPPPSIHSVDTAASSVKLPSSTSEGMGAGAEVSDRNSTLRGNPDEVGIKVHETKFTSIASVNPYQRAWCIKGVIVGKSDVRRFINQKGEGKLFTMEMLDQTGQIKITAFNDVVDIFYPIFEVGKVYTISKATVRPTNKQYSRSKLDYEIHLDKGSVVNCILDSEVETKYFLDVTKIADMSTEDDVYDVVGIIKEIYPTGKVFVKSTRLENQRRNLIIMDETGSIRVTLWGSKCDLPLEKDSVIVIKSAKLSSFNGIKSLSTIPYSQIIINPDFEAAFELKGWYDMKGKDIEVTPQQNDKRCTIQELIDGEVQYSQVIGSIVYIMEDSMWYDSCTTESCNKKVIMEEGGMYRCERCNKLIDGCNQSYMINARISDHTNQIWVSMFNDVGESLLGVSASQMKNMAEESIEQMQELVKNLYYKEFVLKIRGKQGMYQNEPKMRWTVLSAVPLDIVKEAGDMTKAITSTLCG